MLANTTNTMTYFTVGPTQLYPTAKSHARLAITDDLLSLSHTSDFFIDIYRRLTLQLKKLFAIPETYQIFFAGSSTESMHTIIASCAEKYTTHLIVGGFSEKFYKAAIDLGKEATAIKLDWRMPIQLSNLSLSSSTELIAITENETSLGVNIDLSDLSAVKTERPDVIIAVDIVSSAPYVALDYSNVDIAFFSSHKGFGLPAGLGIMIVSESAIEKARKLRSKGVVIGGHHSILNLAEKAETFRTPETPNVLAIYLLQKITADLIDKGIDNVRSETRKKAELIYAYFDNHRRYRPLIRGSQRSLTTIVIDVKGNARYVTEQLEKQGYAVSKGYRPNEDNYIRIANFPAHTLEDTKGLIAAFDKIEIL
jgi:phosphoserine aminotransferase